MKAHFFALCLILALAGCALAQESGSTSQTAASAQATAQSPNQAAVEGALKAYVSANDRRSMDELVALWPDLPNQKKEYKKIKEFFSDTSIANPKMTVQPLEIQSMKDDAIVKCARTQEFVKTHIHTEFAGDAMMSNPAQRPPPQQRETKENKKKTETTWIKLHKQGDDWKIVSISDKPQSM